ncbi:DUF2188 domain-containing protein [Macrococcus animalis]|uniref:DUF2188 domain-containing protein n=1 Tax=Macrococcus animalis TaxID=3395467 RepID=UPI0039BE488F
MTSKNQHVVLNPNGGWDVKGEGNTNATSHHDTQAKAIEAGKTIAKNQQSELVVHGQDGKIRQKDSFGNDPTNSKG